MLPLLAAAPPFLAEMVVLLVVSVVIAYLSLRLKLVPIAGFLIAGVLIGPGAFGLVQDRELIEGMAEIGVILLLFSIGVEFSIEKLNRIRRAIFVGGGVQTFGTVALTTVVLMALGVSWNAALFTGFLVGLSSTAIVLSLLAERGETDTPTGSLSLAVLIFQDFAVILMVLFVPILAGGASSPIDALLVLGRALLVIVVAVVAARKIVPMLLERVAHTRRPELFLLTVVALCFGIAWLVALADVSVALGAFIAGLVVSESRYSDQALGEILPLRTVFNAVFFVSVGMLLDLFYVFENPLTVVAIGLAVLLVKAVVAGAAVVVLKYPVRVAAAVGLTLAQIGEFSFVLERAGEMQGLYPAGLEEGSQAFIAVSVLLMIATPFLVSAGAPVGAWLARTRLGRWGREPAPPPAPALEDHTIVVGYGPAGQRLAGVLRDSGIPYVIVELNPAATARADGHEHVLIGDASRAHLLEAAAIERAKLLVLATSDADANLRIAYQAKHHNPTLQVVARARYLSQVEPLHAAGADIVVPEELETTVRLFSHVLGAYMVAPDEIEAYARALRAGDYQVLRGSIQEAHLMVLQGFDEDGLHTRAVMVREGAPVAGKTLAELHLRGRHHLTVLAVRRGVRTFGSPAGSFRLQPGDRLVLIGQALDFADSAPLFRPVDEPLPPFDLPDV
jgi:CPA2 family monovalent cation:H+ antiporter-2